MTQQPSVRWCPVCNADTERRPHGQCRPCHNRREKDRARANPGPSRHRAAKWYADNRERALIASAERYQDNKEAVAEAGRKWREKNPELAAARHRTFIDAHPDYQRDRGRRRKKDDAYKAAVREGVRRYRTRKLGNETIPYRDIDIFNRDGWICHLCGSPIDPTVSRRDRLGASIDHLVPVSKGGADRAENVAAAHLTCNQRRNNRSLEEIKA